MEPRSIPLIHITDLYHPPQDPDDQLDLATVLALPEFDLRGVVLDVTQRFIDPAPNGWDLARDPGYVVVTQAAALAGRAIPVARGPRMPLAHSADDARGAPLTEQAGIELVLSVLAAAPKPVTVSMVGSARVLVAAYNRAPELVQERVGAVLLNAGSTVGGEKEWNVGLDAEAFKGLWRSGLPVCWYPCATQNGAFDPLPERGTHWKATHAALFEGIPAAWRGWFAYGLSGSARGDFIRAMSDMGRGAVWENLMAGSRAMWSTASLVMATGRQLVRTESGWKFLGAEETARRGLETWPWRLDRIRAEVDDLGNVQWAPTEEMSNTSLFGRQPGIDYGAAMTEALNALFRTLPE